MANPEVYFVLQFVVVEFNSTNEDDKFLEVGLASWIQERNGDQARIMWPLKDNLVPTYVVRSVPSAPSWDTHEVKIKRSYGEFLIRFCRL